MDLINYLFVIFLSFNLLFFSFDCLILFQQYFMRTHALMTIFTVHWSWSFIILIYFFMGLKCRLLLILFKIDLLFDFNRVFFWHQFWSGWTIIQIKRINRKKMNTLLQSLSFFIFAFELHTLHTVKLKIIRITFISYKPNTLVMIPLPTYFTFHHVYFILIWSSTYTKDSSL